MSYSYLWDVNAASGTIYYMLTADPGNPDIKSWYDVLDRVRREDVEIFGGVWNSKLTSYDAKGNVATSTRPYKSGETIFTTTYAYDNYNRVQSATNSIGSTTYGYAYSGGNLTTTITNPANQVSSKVTDAAGKLISATDYGGTLTYSYLSLIHI